MPPLGAAFVRRGALGSLAALAAGAMGGCAPPGDAGSTTTNDLFVGLGRARHVVVLDTVTDQELRRISLAPLGQSNVPWLIGVGPAGTAAVIPLDARQPSIGLIAGRQPAARGVVRARSGRALPEAERCAALGIATGFPTSRSPGTLETEETLAADGLGHVYVVLGDGGSSEPSYAAVVDLQRSITLRHLPLAPIGEAVLSLAGAPDGLRLFASIWAWQGTVMGGVSGAGRLVAIDVVSGTPLVRSSLPASGAVIDTVLAAPPPSAPAEMHRALYAVVADPGPDRREDDVWQPRTRYFLAALDPSRLDPIGWWPLDERPRAVAISPDGSHAYLLAVGSWQSRLACLDLAQGAVTHLWHLPAGCVGLAVSPVGKAYVAEPLADRLWRVDTQRNVLLAVLPLTGAPMALATA